MSPAPPAPQLDPPEGWFAVGFSDELARGAVRAIRFVGRELVLFRTASGTAGAFSAHCPHMGAHLGKGGTVVGESLRCPFHGLRFERSGRCVAGGSEGPPPPSARAEPWPLRERNGVLLLHHTVDGREPEWEVPELDESGWSSTLRRSWRLRGHPQETNENSVDLAHFRALHQYDSVEMVSELRTSGSYLNARYAMTRKGRLFGVGPREVRAEFEVHVHGLGYSLVEASVPAQGVRTRHFIFATPTDPGWIDLRIAMSAADVVRPGQIHPILVLVPPSLVTRLVRRLVFRGFAHDVAQDLEVWENKIFVATPRLARDDGPIAAYRRWAQTQYGPAAARGQAAGQAAR